MALSSILHGINVIHFHKTDIEKLQRIENKEYRMINSELQPSQPSVLRGEVGTQHEGGKNQKRENAILKLYIK